MILTYQDQNNKNKNKSISDRSKLSKNICSMAHPLLWWPYLS